MASVKKVIGAALLGAAGGVAQGALDLQKERRRARERKELLDLQKRKLDQDQKEAKGKQELARFRFAAGTLDTINRLALQGSPKTATRYAERFIPLVNEMIPGLGLDEEQIKADISEGSKNMQIVLNAFNPLLGGDPEKATSVDRDQLQTALSGLGANSIAALGLMDQTLKKMGKETRETEAAKRAGFITPEDAPAQKLAAEIDLKRAQAERARRIEAAGLSPKQARDLRVKFTDQLKTDKALNDLNTRSNQAQNVANLATEARTNPIAAGTVSRAVAKAAGEVGRLTEQDVQAFQLGKAGSLTQRFKSTMQKMIKGTITEEESKFLMRVSAALSEQITKDRRKRQEFLARRFAKASDLDVGTLIQIAGPDTPERPADGEIRRRTKDGRIAVFDQNKKFLRYE